MMSRRLCATSTSNRARSGSISGGAHFDFAARENVACRLQRPFQRHDRRGASAAANAQGHLALLEVPARRVEIDRNQLAGGADPSPRSSGEASAAAKPAASAANLTSTSVGAAGAHALRRSGVGRRLRRGLEFRLGGSVALGLRQGFAIDHETLGLNGCEPPRSACADGRGARRGEKPLWIDPKTFSRKMAPLFSFQANEPEK